MFTRTKLDAYVQQGLITVQTHPACEEVCIYNYTQKCQYEGLWDEVTTKCRGLIIDWRGVPEGNEPKILSNPIPKFFNWEEHVQKGLPIPEDIPLIYEKMDGWLGILYWLDDKPWIATRGSFTSPGAEWATKWFREFVDWENITDRDWTHIFEIISPITRIVCNYDYEGLVWLTARHLRYTEVDVAAMPEYNVAPLHLKDSPMRYGGKAGDMLRKASLIPHADYETLKKMEGPNQEGFVIAYPNGLRLKIKFDEYKRLHKIITGVSAIGIWEMMSQGQPINFENVPDEFFKWVEETQNKLRAEFAKIWGEAMLAVEMVKGKPTRKDQAVWLMQNKKEVSSVAFSILDGEMKKAVQQVYKMIRPHGAQPYKKDD